MTIGEESSQVIENVNEQPIEVITGGAQREQNLFHSFEEFNVSEGRGAYFNSPNVDIQNIFSRVTGSNPSEIMGVLGTFGESNPDLYLINPNGIIFGENAALDVQGSFTATTADGIEFSEGGLFSAVAPGESLLTISVPLGLQFGSSPGSIINRSFVTDNTGDFVGLQVPSGENLTLVGGEILFDGGEATARGGNINIGGLSKSGTVTFNDDGSLSFLDGVEKADVTFTNAADTDVRSTGGGSININAGNLKVKAGESGSSQLRAGILSNSTSPKAIAGNITLNADNNLTIDNSSILNELEAGGIGNAGDINLIAGSIDITNRGLVEASTYSQGDAGSINIFTDNSVNVGDENGATFIANNVYSNAKGNSQGINFSVGSLFVNNGAQIQSLTEGEGNSGKIFISASNTVSFNGPNASGSPAGAFSIVLGGKGNSGGIDIFARSLSMTNRTQLNGDTRGVGDAGDINIEVDEDVKLVNSIIISEITEGAGEGEGGNITIKTGSLFLQDGSSLLADTENIGNAGDINVEAREKVVLEGSGPSALDLNLIVPSQISAQVDSFEGSRGEGGNINISTPFLSIADAGFISTSTSGLGNAGNINLGSEQLFIEQLNVINRSQISVSTFGQGKAGEIEIYTNSLSLDNDGLIDSRSETDFDAGDITLNIANSLQATDSSISTSSDKSSGGNLTIAAGDIQLRGNSDFTTNIFSGEGSGGNINITADSIIAFDDSDIFASAPEGQGGDITLDTPAFFAENFTLNSLTAENTELLENNNRADVNATGEVLSGSVSIPDVSFIQNSITELPDNSLNTDELVANSCVVPTGDRSQGKFIITGTESLPVRPGGNLPSKYPTGKVRGVSEDKNSWQPGDPIVEPQGVYRLANGKLVLSRECSQ